jgi:hypothetical protein
MLGVLLVEATQPRDFLGTNETNVKMLTLVIWSVSRNTGYLWSFWKKKKL